MRSFFVRSCFALAAACGISTSAHAGGFVVTTARPVIATTAIVSPFVTAPVVVSAPFVATPQLLQLQAVPTVIAPPTVVSARQFVRNVVVRQRVMRALCR